MLFRSFIVAVFEGLLQSGGQPGVALQLLLVGATLVIAVVTLSAIGLRRWKRAPQPED